MMTFEQTVQLAEEFATTYVGKEYPPTDDL